jgi:hypothetical protein
MSYIHNKRASVSATSMYAMGMSMKPRGPEAEGAEGCLCYVHTTFRDSSLAIHDPAFRPEDKACDGTDTGF